MITYRQAGYEYEFLHVYTAGISLLGSEVKSLREGKCNLKGNYCKFVNGELFGVNIHISECKNTNESFQHEPLRLKKFLLNKSELTKLSKGLDVSGCSIIVYKIFLNERGKFKAELILVKGKKQYDKKNAIKGKDIDMETKRTLKNI